jgi:protein-disulfide isomerase
VVKHAFEPRIHEDLMSGDKSGVKGTSTFFIKEHRHNGSYEFKSLDEAIKSAINQKS